jgi:hypothetical protein
MNYGKGKKVNIATPIPRPNIGARNEAAIDKGMYREEGGQMVANIPTPKRRPKRVYNGVTGNFSSDK